MMGPLKTLCAVDVDAVLFHVTHIDKSILLGTSLLNCGWWMKVWIPIWTSFALRSYHLVRWFLIRCFFFFLSSAALLPKRYPGRWSLRYKPKAPHLPIEIWSSKSTQHLSNRSTCTAKLEDDSRDFVSLNKQHSETIYMRYSFACCNVI